MISVDAQLRKDSRQRKKAILEMLILGSLAVGIIATFIMIAKTVLQLQRASAITPLECALLVVVLLTLYRLSRRGLDAVVTPIFIAIAYTLATYTAVRWGLLVPQAVLAYVIVIIVTGILSNSKSAFIVTLLCTVTLVVVLFLGESGTIVFDLTWMDESAQFGDVVIYGLTFIIVAIVSWLSGRETNRSLMRALSSELELKQERDNLEENIKSRSDELEKLQLDKTIELQKFAEFGRLSSSLLHDLAGPLMAASMHLEQIEDSKYARLLGQAKDSLGQIERYVIDAKLKLREVPTSLNFDVAAEVGRAVKSLGVGDEKNGIKVQLLGEAHVALNGNAVRFNRIITNIVANAMDAQVNNSPGTKKIVITVTKRTKTLEIDILDYGRGIPKDVMPHIFEAFYSTKPGGRGIGIGLAIAKRMTEDDFGGTLTAKNVRAAGALFTLTIPMNDSCMDSE